jgi:hypothetical protein
MKKTIFIIVLLTILLLMPTFVALPTTNITSQYLLMSDGTFVGGFGRGHWGNGKFNIDSIYAYINGVYTSTSFLKINGEITKEHGKIGEISAFIISNKVIFGHKIYNQIIRYRNRFCTFACRETTPLVDISWFYRRL